MKMLVMVMNGRILLSRWWKSLKMRTQQFEAIWAHSILVLWMINMNKLRRLWMQFWFGLFRQAVLLLSMICGNVKFFWNFEQCLGLALWSCALDSRLYHLYFMLSWLIPDVYICTFAYITGSPSHRTIFDVLRALGG